MRCIHIAIRRTNAGRTRRRLLLSGHGEGSAHVTAGQMYCLRGFELRGNSQSDGRRADGGRVNGMNI